MKMRATGVRFGARKWSGAGGMYGGERLDHHFGQVFTMAK